MNAHHKNVVKRFSTFYFSLPACMFDCLRFMRTSVACAVCARWAVHGNKGLSEWEEEEEERWGRRGNTNDNKYNVGEKKRRSGHETFNTVER